MDDAAARRAAVGVEITHEEYRQHAEDVAVAEGVAVQRRRFVHEAEQLHRERGGQQRQQQRPPPEQQRQQQVEMELGRQRPGRRHQRMRQQFGDDERPEDVVGGQQQRVEQHLERCGLLVQQPESGRGAPRPQQRHGRRQRHEVLREQLQQAVREEGARRARRVARETRDAASHQVAADGVETDHGHDAGIERPRGIPKRARAARRRRGPGGSGRARRASRTGCRPRMALASVSAPDNSCDGSWRAQQQCAARRFAAGVQRSWLVACAASGAPPGMAHLKAGARR